MSTTEQRNEAVFRRWFDEVWNGKRREAIFEMLDADARAHGMGPNGTVLCGCGPFCDAFDLFTRVFPDLHISVDQVVASGDMVAGHVTCTATHTGDGLGVPGTGKRVTFPCMTMARYRDGKIVEGWNVIDLMSAMRQIQAVELSQALP